MQLASRQTPMIRQTKQNARARLRGLDILRGIAAMAVVLFHYTYLFANFVGPHSTAVLFAFSYGRFGVNLFFVISGFVILMTLERSPHIRDFAVSRFSRLYPPYVACMAITVSILQLSGTSFHHVTLQDALLNLTMLREVINYPMIDWSYWTLTYEVLFYGYIGLIYFLLRPRRIEIFCLAWLAISYFYYGLHLPLAPAIARLAEVLLIAQYGYLFIAGMMLWRLFSGKYDRLTWFTLIAAMLTCPYVEHEGVIRSFSDLKIFGGTIVFVLSIHVRDALELRASRVEPNGVPWHNFLLALSRSPGRGLHHHTAAGSQRAQCECRNPGRDCRGNRPCDAGATLR